MKKKYFAEYIDEIDRIAKEARIRQDLASIALKKAEEKLNKDLKKTNLSVARKSAYREEFAEAEAAYRKEVEKIRVKMENDFRVLRGDLKKDVYEYLAADPGKVDQNAVALLSSGAINGVDLAAMSNKYWNNPTMLKLIKDRAENVQDDAAKSIRRTLSVHLNPETRLTNYDSAVHIAMKTIRHESGLSDGMQK